MAPFKTMMKYDTNSLRRQDRALPESDAHQLLHSVPYGILCLQDTNGGGYGIPLNYAWDGADTLYMHCAGEGHKLDCLRQEPRATFVLTGDNSILPAKFSTAYESVLVHGIAQIVETEDEKFRALQLLIQKLTPQEQARGDEYIARAIHATTVIRFSMNHICGKAHRA